MKCPSHRNSDICMVCTTCHDELVCLECIATSHRGHTVMRLDDVKKDLQRRLKNSGQIIGGMRSDMINTAIAIKEQNEVSKEVSDQINEHRASLHKALDEIADHVLGMCEKQRDKNVTMLKDQESNMGKKINAEEEFSENLRVVLRVKDPVELIQNYKALKKPSIKRFARPFLNPLQFRPGVVQPKTLKKMFGIMVGETLDASPPVFPESVNGLPEIDSPSISPEMGIYSRAKILDTPIYSPVNFGHYSRLARPRETPRHSPEYNLSRRGKVTPRNLIYTERKSPIGAPTIYEQNDTALSLVTTFRHSSIGISFICPSFPGHAWLKCYNQKEIRLTNKAGNIKQTVNFDTKIGGLALAPDNKVLVCCVNAQCVKQVSLPSNKVSTVFYTAPLKPNFICTTANGEVVMSLVDSVQYGVTSESQRVVVRYTRKYQEICRAQLDKFGNNMFVLPCQVRVNQAGNIIAVTNETNETSAHLVLLDNNCNIKLRYLGEGRVSSPDKKLIKSSLSTKFYINDLDFDSRDNIVLVESYSRTVQLLDPTCQLLRILIQEHDMPWALSVNMYGEIWMGMDNGKVKIFK